MTFSQREDSTSLTWVDHRAKQCFYVQTYSWIIPLIHSPGSPLQNKARSVIRRWALMELSLLWALLPELLLLLLLLPLPLMLLMSFLLLTVVEEEATAASITRVAICRAVFKATDDTDTLLRLSLLIFRHCDIKLLTVASVRYWDLLVVRDKELAIWSSTYIPNIQKFWIVLSKRGIIKNLSRKELCTSA